MTGTAPGTGRRAARRLSLGLLLLLAFALRLFQLDAQDIWGDEAWSITVSAWSLSEIVAGDAETNPPFYHIALHLTRRLLGDSVFALRYLSLVSGVVAVAFLAPAGRWLADRRPAGRRLAVWALVAGAVSPFLIYYAQEARMYGTALLGAAGSVAFFLRLWAATRRGQPSPPGPWLGYAAFSLVAVYSHYFAFAVLLVQAAAVLLALAAARRGHSEWRRRLGPWLLIWLVMAALFAPWILIARRFLSSKTSARFQEWTFARLLEIGHDTWLAYANGTTVTAAERPWGWLVLFLALLGLAWLWRQAGRPAALWAGGMVLGAVIFAWSVNPVMPFFYERYLLVATPAFLLLVGAGLARLWQWRAPAAALALTGLLTLHVVAWRHNQFDPAFAKGGYGQLMGRVAAEAGASDLILLNNPLQASLYDYYQPEGIDARLLSRDEILTPAGTDATLAATTAGYGRVWLVESGNPAEYDPEGRVQAWLGRQGSFVLAQSYPGARLMLFDLAPAPAGAQAVSARLGEGILLTGYGVSATRVQAGSALRLTLTWASVAPVADAYTVFNHLVGADGLPVAQADGQPVGGSRPTSSWLPGERIDDSYAILIPEGVPAGRYRLQVGMYLWPELTRLPASNDAGAPLGDAVFLTTILVVVDED